jgi:hypothetical protein
MMADTIGTLFALQSPVSGVSHFSVVSSTVLMTLQTYLVDCGITFRNVLFEALDVVIGDAFLERGEKFARALPLHAATSLHVETTGGRASK